MREKKITLIDNFYKNIYTGFGNINLYFFFMLMHFIDKNNQNFNRQCFEYIYSSKQLLKIVIFFFDIHDFYI